MNIDGLSEAFLDRFLEAGLLNDYADIYHLKDHREKICQMEGFGEKSVDKLLSAIESSRNTEPYRLLAALGIPGIGSANAKLLADHFQGDIQQVMNASPEEIASIEGFGDILAHNIRVFFDNEQNRQITEKLLTELRLSVQEALESVLAGKTVVITGTLHHFENREALIQEIEKRGGKVSSSVSSKTAYLVNNDLNSTSSKNKKARQLGIPILSEEELLSMF